MKINTKLHDIHIHPAVLKLDYYYINCHMHVTVNIDDAKYKAILKTGLTYNDDDYSKPSNALRVYSETSPTLLWELNNTYENELDNMEIIDSINYCSRTNYTQDELKQIYFVLTHLIGEGQKHVDASEAEANNETPIEVN